MVDLRVIREKAEHLGYLKHEIKRLEAEIEKRRDEFAALNNELATLVLAADKEVKP